MQLYFRKMSRALDKKRSIDRHELRDIRYGILGKSRESRFEQNISGRAGPFQIAREWNTDDRCNVASVNSVALNDNDGMLESGL